jgi:hypothetical protein
MAKEGFGRRRDGIDFYDRHESIDEKLIKM